VSTAELSRDVAAAATLRLLALALAPPDDDTVVEVAALAGALAEADTRNTLLAELALAADDADVGHLAEAHERLFGGTVAVAPYEGSYEADPFRQARQMADVAGFYRAFDAHAHGGEAERPDHAGAELEFLSFVAMRRIDARNDDRFDDACRCAELEHAFLADHAGRWLPGFFAELAAAADEPYHRAVARLGSWAITGEIERRGLEIARAPLQRAPRLAVEADEVTCGAAGAMAPVLELAEPHRGRRPGGRSG
jgi:TorA maturation chaperone TorD